VHAAIEELIEQSAAQWTMLRPGPFALNCRTWWAPQIRQSDVVRLVLCPGADRSRPRVRYCGRGRACALRRGTPRPRLCPDRSGITDPA
jgi:hypothetical protein